jgi:hypothetical protein
LAISPQNARKKLIESQQQEIQAAEFQIDAGLSAGRRDFVVPKLSPAALGELKRQYELVGWTISLTTDQREGSYWHFTERPST